MKEGRPKLHLEWSNLDYLMEALAFGGAVWGLLIAVGEYGDLPERIPIHFNAGGIPDDWGPRAMVFLLPLIGFGQYLLMTFLNYYPHSMNYPVKITAENAEYQYRLSTRLIRFMKMFLCVAFGVMTWYIVKVAKGEATGLPGWLLWGFLVGTLLPILVYLVLVGRKKN